MEQQGCKACGRVPAERFVIKRHVGMILMQKFYKLDEFLCRDHALQFGKDYLNKTLLLGWWGIVSFFVNFTNIAADLAVLARAKKMDPPAGQAAVATTWAPPVSETDEID